MRRKLVLLPLLVLLIAFLISSGASADTWYKTGANFTGTGNTDAYSLSTFGGYLYVGTYKASGAEIWRSLDGMAWYKTGADFTGTGNTVAYTLSTFGGYLYVGTYNASGAQIWRTSSD